MERCPSWPKEHDWKSCVRLKRTVGSNPTLSAKPRIRAHLASFLYDSDCGHLRFGKLPCPHIRKNAICNPSSRFGGSVLSAKPRPKEPQTGSFFVAERVGSHTCAFSNAQGAQVCAKRKPDEPHKSHSVERSKNNE